MAQKKITDLTLRSDFDETCYIPLEDSSQTYRASGAQIKDFVFDDMSSNLGDGLKQDNAGDPFDVAYDNSTIGVNGSNELEIKNEGVTAAKLAADAVQFPLAYLAGGKLANNASDATNDIDVSAGVARDSTNVSNISWAALIKQLDAAWAAGTNQGMRDTGSISDATWHIFAIRKDSDGSGDILASLSPTAPTMPTGYTYFRRIGSILRESGAIVSFLQFGDYFQRKSPKLDVDTSAPGTTAVNRDLSVPSGIKVLAEIIVTVAQASSGRSMGYFSDPDCTDLAPSASVAPLAQVVGAALSYNDNGFNQLRVVTNTSKQIRSRVSYSDGSTTLRIATQGWHDLRGKE